ncbi:sugar transferase [Maribacter hydrothermalis]|uniref:Exopolysaccharide biosynthesis protein n=1 Tax=Maribacter hydrothermalis TaxID=1836467 RepID=A0A1B7ZE54_9FLAO|nr:sugar transferase [Maribacter hydrothermalis]APQ17367.1 exopolysaccharide biosynthesis protein [Maribacter hydrothermalis]OBR41845.1 exopolysaccharide biosynthesis protein [Maribacter hydrothermalis]
MAKLSILNSLERKFILLLGDLLIIISSLNVFIYHAIDYVSLKLKIGVFGFGIVSYLLLSYILDSYNLQKTLKRKLVISQALYITGLFVFIVFIFSVIFFDTSFWRIPLLVFLILTPIEIALWRLFFVNVFRVLPTVKNVLLIYDKETGKDFKKVISAIDGDDLETFYRVKLTYQLGQDSDLRKKFLHATEKVDSWIINIRNYNDIPTDLEKVLLKSILRGKDVISYTSFYENTYEALPIQSHNDSFYEILQFRNRKIRYVHTVFSFFVNLILSLVVGFVCLLCIPIVWFLNIFLNRGPLFYTQKRVGLYGNEFKIYKFRSMVVNAEKEGAKMAVKNDVRITPFGRVLRIFRVDELPQILAVIKGDMQFIGPRPERKVFVNQLNSLVPFYGTRHLIKPGITGWAQVKYKYGENLEDSIKKLEYDLYYIKNRSITLDLRIIFKTVTTVLFSRGI